MFSVIIPHYHARTKFFWGFRPSVRKSTVLKCYTFWIASGFSLSVSSVTILQIGEESREMWHTWEYLLTRNGQKLKNNNINNNNNWIAWIELNWNWMVMLNQESFLTSDCFNNSINNITFFLLAIHCPTEI